jgi:hypothetical protein
MAKINLFTTALMFLLMVPALNLGAQEREEQIRKMEQLYEHALEFAEEGEAEESKRVMGAVNRMRRAFRNDSSNASDRPKRQDETREAIADLQRERGELQSALRRGVSDREANEIREELGMLERVIDEKTRMLNESREHGGDRHREHENQSREADRHQRDSSEEEWEHRLNHLRAAAEHLHEAGLHELGEQVENQIGELESERHESHGHDSAELEPLLHEVMGRMDDLNRQVNDLREEVRRLKR